MANILQKYKPFLVESSIIGSTLSEKFFWKSRKSFHVHIHDESGSVLQVVSTKWQYLIRNTQQESTWNQSLSSSRFNKSTPGSQFCYFKLLVMSLTTLIFQVVVLVQEDTSKKGVKSWVISQDSIHFVCWTHFPKLRNLFRFGWALFQCLVQSFQENFCEAGSSSSNCAFLEILANIYQAFH